MFCLASSLLLPTSHCQNLCRVHSLCNHLPCLWHPSFHSPFKRVKTAGVVADLSSTDVLLPCNDLFHAVEWEWCDSLSLLFKRRKLPILFFLLVCLLVCGAFIWVFCLVLFVFKFAWNCQAELMDKQHSQFFGNFTWEVYFICVRLEWAAIFRIFCELEILRKISHPTHLIIVFTKQKLFLAAALKNWHSWQFSLRGCKDADRNGNVTVGWAGGSRAVIHSHPALCYSSRQSQGTNAPLHIRDSAFFKYWEIFQNEHFSLVLLKSQVTILYLELWNFF